MAADFSPLLQQCLAKASRNRVAAPALASATPAEDQARMVADISPLLQHAPLRPPETATLPTSCRL